MSLGDPSAPGPRSVRFGDCELEPATRELTRGGRPVHLQPKVFDVLLYLVDRRDRVVTKDELLSELWPDEVVGETSLTFAVKSVRRAIGDDGATQSMLRTVHGRGYRFVAAVEFGGGSDIDPTPDARGDSRGDQAAPRTASASLSLPGARDRILLQPAPTGFVGRRAEREVLDAEFERATAGQTRTVFVLGEPGVGKTRLAAEFAAAAEAAGADVLVGRCSEGSPPAFWPWTQVVRAHSLVHGEESTRRVAGDGAADLARLFPALLAGAEDSRRQAGAAVFADDSGHERLRLFDSLVAFLREAARERPVVVVLDDLHWADASSLMVLRHLVREVLDAPLLVVGTYRHQEVAPGDPLSELLGWLHRTKRSQRLRLRGLADDDVAAMVRDLAGTEPRDSLVVALGRATDGNPFFVEEFCRDLVHRGALADASGGDRLPIPEEVRELLLRRVLRLGDETRDVLTMAAVLGREFRYEDLVGAAPVDRATVDRALRVAESSGLVHVEPDGDGVFAFSHALVSEVLKESMPRVALAALHRRAGEVLEARGGVDTAERVAALAHHFGAAVVVGEGARALRYAAQLGHLLAANFAYEDAAAQFLRAAELARAGACGDEERFEILLALARARWRAGEEDGARGMVLEAARIARDLGSVEMLAKAALRSAALFPVTPLESLALLEEALAGLRASPEADPRLLSRVLSALASGLYTRPGDVDRREALMDEATDLARRSGDLRALLQVLRAGHVALWRPHHLERRLRLAREHVEVAEALGDKVEMAAARSWYVPALVESGDLDEVDVHVERIDEEAAATRMQVYRANALSFRAMRALSRGRFDEVEHLAQRSYEIARRYNETTASMTLWSQVYYLRREQGRLAEIEAGIHLFAAQAPQVPWDWLVLHLLAEDGREADARALLDTLKGRGLRDSLPPDAHIVSSSAMFGMGEAAWRLRDADLALASLPFLQELGARWVTVGLGGVCLGAASHAAGLALAALGRTGEAVAALERAEHEHRRAGVPVPLLRTRTELAGVLLAAGDRALRRRGSGLLAAVEPDARKLGLVHLLSLAEAAGA